jgi:hypothetical protein
MFGGFPKLFDRAFFIGYFLPAFLLGVGVGANLFAFGYIDEKFTDFLAKKSTAAHALGATISLVFIWLFSILMMTFSRPIIRLLEGYGGRLNPFHILLPWQQNEFKAKAEPHLRKLQSVLDTRRRGVPESEQFSELSVFHAARDFPEKLELVLPTRLGNVMRAYERYSDVVYEIEAIALWPRLFMIIPEDVRERMRESEGLFHFSINMLFTSIVTLVTSGGMIISSLYHGGLVGLENRISWPIILVLVFGAFFAWFSWWRLPDAARQRGEQVKSAFDLYRAELADALGFELPATEDEERRMWRLVSRRMLLRVSDDRLRDYTGSLDGFRKKKVEVPSDKATSARQSGKQKEKAEKEKEKEEKDEEEEKEATE